MRKSFSLVEFATKSAHSSVDIVIPAGLDRSVPESFWKFYTLNQESIEYIVGVQCFAVYRKYKLVPASINFDDLKQSVLERLYDACILAIWNPSLSSIATFITGRAYRYAQKVMTAAARGPYELDHVLESNEKGCKVVRSRRRLVQKLYGEINGMPTDFDDEDDDQECISDTKSTAEAIEQKNLLEVLRDNLDNREKKILDLVLRDHTVDELKKKAHPDPVVSREFLKSSLRVIRRKAVALDACRNVALSAPEKRVSFRFDRKNVMPVAGKNGKKKRMNRSLTDAEKMGLYNLYVSLDGVVDWDTLTEYRINHMSPSIGPDQPSGYFSYLHKMVRLGRPAVINGQVLELQIRDRDAYNANRSARDQTTLPETLPIAV